MATAFGASELDLYRHEADSFVAALDEEYYLHYSGVKPELELEPIYERFSDLTSLDACARLGAAARKSPDGLTELWRFACEGYLGDLTRREAEEVARAESTISAEVDGEPVGYRQLRPAIANEPERGRRERLERVRVELAAEHLDALYRSAHETVRRETEKLGAPTYRELYEEFGFPFGTLAAQCSRLLADTEDLYVRTADALFSDRVGVGLDEAERWDVARLFRATDWDSGFAADAMLPALEGTLADLGIELYDQKNIHLDVEARPNKTPRAFCAPIEVPGRIILVIQPIGGADDWRALFHEAGHAEHFAHTAAALPFEARRLGDNAVTEGWAALLEQLVGDPVWLARRLDFGGIREFAAESAAMQLYLVRRYCAKLLYELELHGSGAELEAMPARYAELIAEATKIAPSPADFLSDVDEGFYVSAYLRSWAFEAQMRTFLRQEFGTAWFTRREAGSLLRELWYEGQGLDADELLREVTGEPVVLDSIVARIQEELH